MKKKKKKLDLYSIYVLYLVEMRIKKGKNNE